MGVITMMFAEVSLPFVPPTRLYPLPAFPQADTTRSVAGVKVDFHQDKFDFEPRWPHEVDVPLARDLHIFERRISVEDVNSALANAKLVVEDYPDDTPCTSRLLVT